MLKLDQNFPFKPKSWPFFYGYFIVLCSTIGFIASAPGQTIGVSVFTDYLIDAIGINRFQLSLAYMFGTIGSAMLIRRAGKLLDHAGVRIIVMSSAIALSLALFYMSQVDRVSHILSHIFGDKFFFISAMTATTLGFMVLRFSGQGVLALSSRTMLMRWFIDLRGRMNSIVGIFVSLTFSASPLLFEILIKRFEWRGAWMILGGSIGIFFTLFVFIFYRDTPEECDLLPDGHEHIDESSGDKVEEENWTLKQTRRTQTFWIFNIGLSMFSLVITAFTFHVVSIFAVAGLPRSEALSIFLPSAILSVGLNILAGWMADSHFFKFRLKYVQMIVLLGLIFIGLGAFLLQTGLGKHLIILGSGMTSGFFGTASSVVWARYFGRKHLGEISGYNMAFLVFFSAIGPSMFGWSFDATGNYSTAIIVCIAILVVLILFSFYADKPKLKK